MFSDSCRESLLGGSEGKAGGGLTSEAATLVVDFVPFNGILDFSTSLQPGKAFDFSTSWYRFSTSSFVRLGGSGGKVAGSKTGALILPASMDDVRESVVLGLPFDITDIDDMVEMVEETDSIEAFLFSRCSEDLLGGKAGDG